MEDRYKRLKSEDGTFKYETYENKENLPNNEQSLLFKDHDDNNGTGNSKKINDEKDNLRENVEESNTKSNSVYRISEDSHIIYSDCGEPLRSQHIHIDFTPVPGVDDNAFLQQKCSDFWKFVSEHPKLQSLKVEKVNECPANECIIDKPAVGQGYSQKVEISAVQLLQPPDIPQGAFATKLKYDNCDDFDKDCSLMETTEENREVKLKKRSNFSGQQLHPELKSRLTVKNRSSIIRSRGCDEVNKLCSEMEQWDLSHPKSMESPNRIPSLNN